VLESLEASHKTDRTSLEIDFGHHIDKALILGTELPEPVPIKTILGALSVTSQFKKKFPILWHEGE